MTTVTCDDDSQNIYNVPVGIYNQQTSDDESKYEEKRKNALIGTGVPHSLLFNLCFLNDVLIPLHRS